MAVVNTAGLSPAEGQAEVMSWPWPLLQMSFSFTAEPNNDYVYVWRRKAGIVLSPVAALDRQYATVGYGNTSFPTVVMIQKGTSSGC